MGVRVAATVHGLLTQHKHFIVIALIALAFPAAAAAAELGDGGAGPAAASGAGTTVGGPAVGEAHPALAPLREPVDSFETVVEEISDRIRERRRAAAARRAREEREAFERLPGGVSRATLEAIAACESGGDPTVVSADGSYRGKYQFSISTWESVGGSGDPAAAPELEQDYRAALLYARAGSSPWPVCGH